MVINHFSRKCLFLLLALAIVSITAGEVQGAKKEKGKDSKKKTYAITETQLQSHLMSFADRFASIMDMTIAKFESLNPIGKSRYEVLELMTFSLHQAFLIAGESDPDVGLLDMLIMNNPELQKTLADFSQLSEVSSRLATTVENLPDQITKERMATIEHAMKSISKERSKAITQVVSEFSAERKAAINDFLAEEQRIKGMLSDLRQTLEIGNELIVSTNNLMSSQSKPFDIGDYQKVLVELSNSAKELTNLATSIERISSNIDMDKLIPQVLKAMDEAEREGEELASHTMRLILIIIGVWFVAYVIARLLILYVSNKMGASAK